jgi:hypothetical protein
VETGQSDDASVDVNCFALNVRKSANTSYDRTYHWTIEKTGSESSLILALEQTFVVYYDVVVDLDDPAFTDDDFAVDGVIGIRNPAPIDATLNDITDGISGFGPAEVDCGVEFPYTLPAGTGMSCSYHADLPDKTTRTNTATVELQNYDYDSDEIGTESGETYFSGTANVNFGAATVTQIDECIDVNDSYEGFLGTVCAGDELPVTFTYTRTIGPYDRCGEYLVENTADFETNDTATTGDDIWTVEVSVPCPDGCTLTLGYWKNHAGFGPQDDMVTDLLPRYLGTHAFGFPIGDSIKVDSAAEAVQYLAFYGSNNIFNASNGINKLYAQLLAAKLNIASGADGSAISATIFAADLYLTTHDSWDWSTLNKPQKSQVLNWMVALDRFNNGLTGPGHCSQ